MTLKRHIEHSTSGATLADLLERILDKGIVIAGDIKVKIVDIELLTIQIRLLICSVDKAKEIGVDWWVGNPAFSRRHIRKLTLALGGIGPNRDIIKKLFPNRIFRLRLINGIRDVNNKFSVFINRKIPQKSAMPPARCPGSAGWARSRP